MGQTKYGNQIIMPLRKKNTVSLLPYIRENIYGLTPDVAQISGWEIKKFNIEKQWQISKGEGVKIAVIDTGCDLDHPDLKNNIIQGINFVDPKKDPYDDNGHGSHTAGTIAAEDNSVGMVGVAPKAKIIPIKALNEKGSGNLQHIIDSIVWAANNSADFISMSLGSPQPSPALQNAINYASSKGSIIFCAAGNSGEDVDIMYPAKYDNTIAIGAIDQNLQRTSFTCSGETLDFLAPGHDILSCVPGRGYALMSGTSMSTPFAVGCAALLLSHARQIEYSAISGMLKNSEDYVKVFKKKAQNLSDPRYSGQKRYQGYGILYPVL
jgi:subtilisin family serine protease